jgi:ABC-2 type transport system permease protein
MSGNGNYLQFMAPGVIAMTVLFASMFSGIGLLWDRQFGFLKETLVAIVFAAAGTAIGSTLKDMQGFQMVKNFLVLPLFFLSGALYPLDNLPKALVVLRHIDPMTYGVDGMRAFLINRTHFGATVDALVLVGAGAALTVVGAWRFSKIEV